MGDIKKLENKTYYICTSHFVCQKRRDTHKRPYRNLSPRKQTRSCFPVGENDLASENKAGRIAKSIVDLAKHITKDQFC